MRIVSTAAMGIYAMTMKITRIALMMDIRSIATVNTRPSIATIIRPIIITGIFLNLLFGCAPRQDPLPVAERIITSPLQEFGDAAISSYENGVKRWQLDADYMSRPLDDTGHILVIPVRINTFDTLGRLSSRILADSGASDSRMESFDLWGSVHIKTSDGMIVKSQRLKWHKNTRKVTSDTYVQVETPKGDVLRGRGLDATDNFSRFSFKADVRGRFPDFKRRMEEEGKNEDFFR